MTISDSQHKLITNLLGSHRARPMKKGRTGVSVRALQLFLREHGFDPGRADGRFGDKTEKALKQFQSANGLQADGRVGSRTYGMIRERVENLPAPIPMARPDTSEEPSPFSAGIDKYVSASPRGQAEDKFTLADTWPARLAKTAASAFMLPGDVYAGKVDPNSDEAIRRSAELGTIVTGTPGGIGGIGAGVRIAEKQAPRAVEALRAAAARRAAQAKVSQPPAAKAGATLRERLAGVSAEPVRRLPQAEPMRRDPFAQIDEAVASLRSPEPMPPPMAPRQAMPDTLETDIAGAIPRELMAPRPGPVPPQAGPGGQILQSGPARMATGAAGAGAGLALGPGGTPAPEQPPSTPDAPESPVAPPSSEPSIGDLLDFLGPGEPYRPPEAQESATGRGAYTAEDILRMSELPGSVPVPEGAPPPAEPVASQPMPAMPNTTAPPAPVQPDSGPSVGQVFHTLQDAGQYLKNQMQGGASPAPQPAPDSRGGASFQYWGSDYTPEEQADNQRIEQELAQGQQQMEAGRVASREYAKQRSANLEVNNAEAEQHLADLRAQQAASESAMSAPPSSAPAPPQEPAPPSPYEVGQKPYEVGLAQFYRQYPDVATLAGPERVARVAQIANGWQQQQAQKWREFQSAQAEYERAVQVFHGESQGNPELSVMRGPVSPSSPEYSTGNSPLADEGVASYQAAPTPAMPQTLRVAPEWTPANRFDGPAFPPENQAGQGGFTIIPKEEDRLSARQRLIDALANTQSGGVQLNGRSNRLNGALAGY